MRVYTVHLRRHGLDPDRDFRLIREGFSLPAFLLGPLWALWHRLWLAAVLLVVLREGLTLALYHAGADLAVRIPVDAAIAVATGLVANDLLRRRAAKDGFADLGVVAAEDRDGAERRFLDARPDVATAMAS